jgi:membrane protein YdbS with pleckstrin-like domain
MANNQSTASSSGISFAGALTVLFIGLKITHYINWSWWWVLSPLWIGLAAVIIIACLIYAVAMIVAMVEHYKTEKRREQRKKDLENKQQEWFKRNSNEKD